MRQVQTTQLQTTQVHSEPQGQFWHFVILFSLKSAGERHLSLQTHDSFSHYTPGFGRWLRHGLHQAGVPFRIAVKYRLKFQPRSTPLIPVLMQNLAVRFTCLRDRLNPA